MADTTGLMHGSILSLVRTKKEHEKLPQENYVIEECTELIQTLLKQSRGGGSGPNAIFEEACDVLVTVYTLLHMNGCTWKQIDNEIMRKCSKAMAELNQAALKK